MRFFSQSYYWSAYYLAQNVGIIKRATWEIIASRGDCTYFQSSHDLTQKLVFFIIIIANKLGFLLQVDFKPRHMVIHFKKFYSHKLKKISRCSKKKNVCNPWNYSWEQLIVAVMLAGKVRWKSIGEAILYRKKLWWIPFHAPRDAPVWALKCFNIQSWYKKSWTFTLSCNCICCHQDWWSLSKKIMR